MCFAIYRLYGIFGKIIDLQKWYGIGWQQFAGSLRLEIIFWTFTMIICMGVAIGNKVAMCFPPIISSALIGFIVMAAMSSGWLNVPIAIAIFLPFILWGYCAWAWIINQRRK